MPEYFVNILNWPVNADTPQRAAKVAAEMLDRDGGSGFEFTVTDKPGTLIPQPTGIFNAEEYNEGWERIDYSPDLDALEEFPHLREMYENEPDQI